jgi:membrane-bound serine protease (ClpP class)
MKKLLGLCVLLLAVCASWPAVLRADDEASSPVHVVAVNGAIGPVTSEFITKGIDRAAREGAHALVIELDTPGGLDTSMREIIKAMNASVVPVIVYVSPGGARAASAGAFITIAAHVAAMAPQTNIGAAHPVGVGSKMDETMAEKATNDAAAYMRSLANERGRNAQWAEDAVRKSISASAGEALAMGVIDLIADSVPDLMKELDGRKVKTASGEVVLSTSGRTIERTEMGTRYRILEFITNPNVAYILMILGFYGLFFEMTNPGAIFPGVVGGIFLILAFYSFQSLPVNYAGLLLILLALVLFILETQIPSFGVLTIGGVISMTLGSIMLFEEGETYVRLSLAVVLPVVITTAVFIVVVLGLVIKAQRRRPTTGAEGLVGLEGVATTDITPEGGSIIVHGERWAAASGESIEKGARVLVVAVEGLRMTVKMKT